ncbi:MAG: magnesium chelatase domain-containing protein [Patescibacteria group bacterium]|nr:magnesium chelatase domain-containing protein [Patescibacteria group bacterium]
MTANKLSKIYSATTLGLSTPLIEVELDITRSIPKFTIVGLGDTAVQESRERVMSAIKNSGFEFPRGKVTVNLAPADIRKQGPFFDLPICMALLQSQKDITKDLSSALFIGEVALDGSLRHVNGALSITIAAREAGFQELYLPLSNIQEATLIDGIDIYGIENIKQLVQHLNGVSPLDPHPKQDPYQFDMQSNISVDFSDIK